MEFEVVNNSGSDLGGSNPTVIKVVGCGGGGVYLAAESARKEQGKQSRVVDVGVGEEHKIYIGGSYGYLDVFEDVLALFHSEIDKEFLAASLDICAAARDLVGSAYEHHFHG